MRYGASDYGKRVVLGDRLLRIPVLSASNALDGALSDKPRKNLAVNAFSGRLSGGEYPPLPRELQGFFDSWTLYV